MGGVHDVGLKIALIGVAGMAAQWLVWRLPAIVLLLVAGFLAGPATPSVASAVAIR